MTFIICKKNLIQKSWRHEAYCATSFIHLLGYTHMNSEYEYSGLK